MVRLGPGSLGNVEYSFVGITPRSTLTHGIPTGILCMGQIKIIIFYTWNNLTVCKQMSSDSFKNVILKLFIYISCMCVCVCIYMYIYIYIKDLALNYSFTNLCVVYEQDLALNHLQGLTCHETNQSSSFVKIKIVMMIQKNLYGESLMKNELSFVSLFLVFFLGVHF